MYGFVPTAAPFATAFSGASVAVPTCAAPVAKWTMAKSQSVPFLEAPADLRTSVVGYTGFDPIGLSSYVDQDYAIAGELKNGRVAMLACLGMLVQEFVQLPGGPAFGNTNPLKAAQAVPVEGWIQIITFISLVELATFKRTYEKGADLGFDPLGMNSPENQLKEVKNGRLAMLAAIGMIFQTLVFGEGPISQLSHLGSVYPSP